MKTATRHAHRAVPDGHPSPWLLQHAQSRPEAADIREKSRVFWKTLSWRELADELAALAAGLSAQGLKRGDPVGLLSENRPRLFAARAAAQWLGGMVVQLFADTTADEIAGPSKAQTSPTARVFDLGTCI